MSAKGSTVAVKAVDGDNTVKMTERGELTTKVAGVLRGWGSGS